VSFLQNTPIYLYLYNLSDNKFDQSNLKSLKKLLLTTSKDILTGDPNPMGSIETVSSIKMYVQILLVYNDLKYKDEYSLLIEELLKKETIKLVTSLNRLNNDDEEENYIRSFLDNNL